jgi:hypothetical protein
MRVGTRASALALAQAHWVGERLHDSGTQAEIVEITTLGDRGTAIQDKSRWVSELERALLDGRIESLSTPPRTSRPSSPRDWSWSRCRLAPTLATRSAAPPG